jgi:hypothetical protein
VFLRDFFGAENAHTLLWKEVLVSGFQSNYWLLNEKGFADRWADDRGIDFPAQNYLQAEVQFQGRLVQEVLCMGVMYVQPGTLSWSGKRFSATGQVPLVEVAVDVQGELRTSESGDPLEIEVVYRYPKTVVVHRIFYTYDATLTNWPLPARFAGFWRDAGNDRQLFETSIREIDIAEAELEPESFDAAPYIQANRMQTRLLRNNKRYLVLPAGLKYFDSVENPPVRPKTLSSPKPPPMAYAGRFGLNAGIAFLAIKIIKSTNKRKV